MLPPEAGLATIAAGGAVLEPQSHAMIKEQHGLFVRRTDVEDCEIVMQP
jgi:hypothetical protein